MSPSTPSEALSPTIELQHSKSFDSSSISSKSLKKTSVSADMTSLIRQRVRQQAKSLVDKKRGSVQLAKRLLRSQTLQSVETPFSPDDSEATDRQLEHSIQVSFIHFLKVYLIFSLALSTSQKRFLLKHPTTFNIVFSKPIYLKKKVK